MSHSPVSWMIAGGPSLLAATLDEERNRRHLAAIRRANDLAPGLFERLRAAIGPRPAPVIQPSCCLA